MGWLSTRRQPLLTQPNPTRLPALVFLPLPVYLTWEKDDDDYYEGTEMNRKIDEGRTLAVRVQLHGVSLLSYVSSV